MRLIRRRSYPPILTALFLLSLGLQLVGPASASADAPSIQLPNGAWDVTASVVSKEAANDLEFGLQTTNGEVTTNDPVCPTGEATSCAAGDSKTFPGLNGTLVFYMKDLTCGETFLSTDATHAASPAPGQPANDATHWTIGWDDAGAAPPPCSSPDSDFNDLIVSIVANGADMEMTGKGVATSLGGGVAYANGTDTQNTVQYTIGIRNNGPIDAQNVNVDDQLPTVGDGQQVFSSADFCVGTDAASCATNGFNSYPGNGTLPVGTVASGDSRVLIIRAHVDAALRGGAYPNVTNSATVSSSTGDPVTGNETATSDGIEIDTVPGQPSINLATAGNQKVGLNWSAPAKDGGTPVRRYTVYASPCPTGGARCAVLTNVSSTSNVSNGTFSYFVTGLTNNTNYTFSVTATNDVGEGDASTGASATPNVSADTNQIVNNVGSVDTGFSAGAQGCGTGIPASDPRCKDIVAKWSLTDAKDNGQLVGLSAIPNSSYPGGALPCYDYDFSPPSSTSKTMATLGTGGCVANKATVSTYPTNQNTLSAPHLEYSTFDSSVTTTTLGAPCLALVLNSDGTPKLSSTGRPICASPGVANGFKIDPSTGTNLCPEGGPGWSKTHPCAYIYYDVVQIPGYNLSGSRPCAVGTQGCPNNDDAAIIGSSIQNGIKVWNGTSYQTIVRSWCSGKFPSFTNLPCVFKVMWLNKSTGNGNNDIQWQEYETGDPGSLKTG